MPLVLVDIPARRPGSDAQLEYLPEVDRHEALGEWRTPMRLGDSFIWTELHEHLSDSASKSRVFCHPGVRETLEAAIPKSDLENMLEGALHYLLGKK